MKRLFLTLVVFAALCATAVAGTIEVYWFHSTSLDEDRGVQAYLPDGYDPAAPNGYPAIYFLHGAGGNHMSYPNILAILDNEIAAGRIQPVIMIKPDGSGCTWGAFNGCGWTNSELQGDFEDFVVFDVVAEAEFRYNIAEDPHKRAIMGHSMGGYGAMQAALDHPDLFRVVASHSTYLYFDDLLVHHLPIVLSEQSGPPPWEWHPYSGTLTGGWFLFAGGFSPNLDNPPYFVDFPLNGFGNLITTTWLRWKEHDPAVLAEAIDPANSPAIYFDCGTNDGFLFHPFNVSFDVHLTSLDIEHEWQSYIGDHGSYLNQRFPIALNFIDDAMNDMTAVEDALPSRTAALQVYPNPFNPATTITFMLNREMAVEIGVYSLTGRRVISLANHTFATGSHSLTWNGRDSGGRDLPSGSYVVRLQTETGVEAKRVTLIK